MQKQTDKCFWLLTQWVQSSKNKVGVVYAPVQV